MLQTYSKNCKSASSYISNWEFEEGKQIYLKGCVCLISLYDRWRLEDKGLESQTKIVKHLKLNIVVG